MILSEEQRKKCTLSSYTIVFNEIYFKKGGIVITLNLTL